MPFGVDYDSGEVTVDGAYWCAEYDVVAVDEEYAGEDASDSSDSACGDEDGSAGAEAASE